MDKPKKKKEEIVKAEKESGALTAPPFFVEAEKMFDKFDEISNEIARRAFEFFRARGNEWGRPIDDWFNAETALLRFVPVEISEKDNIVNVTADIAGFRPEDIEISVKDNTLLISGKAEKTEEQKDKNVFYSDFRSNRFFRQLPLPEPVNVDKATAEIKDGMLRIMLPKAADSGLKHIAVSAG